MLCTLKFVRIPILEKISKSFETMSPKLGGTVSVILGFFIRSMIEARQS